MSQTEKDRFNAWWWSSARNVNPSKMHAWVVWLAAAKETRERTEELEAENVKLADIIVEGQGVGALPHMPKRIAELEAALERIAQGFGISSEAESLRRLAREALK
jgi:hypothetical protein